jgi:hypothetical protein
MKTVSPGRLGITLIFSAVLLGLSLVNARAEGFAQKVNDTVNAGARSTATAIGSVPAYFARPYVDDTARKVKIIQVKGIYLDKHNLSAVNDKRCDPYLDLVMTASATYNTFSKTPNAKKLEVEVVNALNKGIQAKCFVRKTAYDMLQPQIRAYWEANRARVPNNSKCVKYATWSDEIVYGKFSDAEKDLALKKLFLDAQENRCLVR